MQYIRTCMNGDQTRRFGVSDVHTQWMTHGWCIRMFLCGISQQPANINLTVWRINRTTRFSISTIEMVSRKTLEAFRCMNIRDSSVSKSRDQTMHKYNKYARATSYIRDPQQRQGKGYATHVFRNLSSNSRIATKSSPDRTKHFVCRSLTFTTSPSSHPSSALPRGSYPCVHLSSRSSRCGQSGTSASATTTSSAVRHPGRREVGPS